jgi:phosphoribosylformimino-5-aminoimidazole carboxamide ribotide isomerase
MMKPIPAVDIMGGKVVRLLQGDAKKVTVYSDLPVEMAGKWASYGVEFLHIVDLDGAFEGNMKNLAIVSEIAKSVPAKIELGGGIRDEAAIEKALKAGVERVVIGTKALDRSFLASIGKKFGNRIVVGIDAKQGMVCTKGWVEKTGVKAIDLVKDIENAGIKTVIYTDIAKDGMLEGPNIPALKELLSSTRIDIIASGGISNIEDIKKLKALNEERLAGVIIGKSLYEKTLDLADAVKVCRGEVPSP